MDPMSVAGSFKGTVFHTWKGNHPCRVYVESGRVYFIRRSAGIDPGTAAVLGSQFGLLGGLAAGLASATKARSPDLVRDDDSTPPEQLLSKHADNYVIAASDIVNPKIEAKGKLMSYGKNEGRWHFTRRGETKETVVLLETPADARQAISLLGGLLGRGLRNESGIAGAPANDPWDTSRWASKADRGSDSELVTDLPVPQDQAEVVDAMANLTKLLGDRAPAAWQKVRCEVRTASPGSPRALEIIVGNGDRPDERHTDVEPDTYQAAMRLARQLSSSVRTFPGVVIEMTRLDQGRWRNNVKLIGT